MSLAPAAGVHSARVHLRAVIAVVICCLCGAAVRGQPESFAEMQALNAELLASRSATQTLEHWCGEHHLADQPRIVARLIRGTVKAPSDEQRQRLRLAAADEVRYRRVQLQCGTRVLSEADNWYVPARLTAEMNRLLEQTETPFGTVVRPLEPTRETLAVTLLWKGEAPVPAELFAHRAVLYTRDHVPFSEVYEVYQREVLAK